MSDFDTIQSMIGAGPRIEYRQQDGSWAELYGHACRTQEEADHYIACLGRNGGMRLKQPQQPAQM